MGVCRHRLLLAGWRNDVLDPHVGNQVAVVFHVVSDVHTEHAEFRRVISEELSHLSPGGVGHVVVGLVAVGEALLQCGHEISFRGLRLFNFLVRSSFAERGGAEKILRVGQVSNDLAVGADRFDGPETVTLFGHLFR